MVGRKVLPTHQRPGQKAKAASEDEGTVKKNTVKFFFANWTYASEKAKLHIIERDDDVVLGAETHQNKERTLALVKFFGAHGWRATASPARPTERSEEGTTGGVIVAVKNNIDNRPLSIATDAEGKLTANAQLTGRLVVLTGVEILALSG